MVCFFPDYRSHNRDQQDPAIQVRIAFILQLDLVNVLTFKFMGTVEQREENYKDVGNMK